MLTGNKKNNMQYQLKDLAAEEINLIGVALSKLPYEAVHGLIGKIRQQCAEVEPQPKAKAPAADPPGEKTKTATK